ncbi:triose-phosphate isomerase [Candidatus Microgenomates bacterium]|nr:triose-phosphate isomerase [Candidatus Microgenomates bacterium]
MKPLIILGNWKANKSTEEALAWVEDFVKNWSSGGALEIILAPSFIHISFLARFIREKGLALKLSAQNVSQFNKGAYTGEVAAEMLRGLVEYSLIGHSERRKNFGETDEILAQKVRQALANGINPVYCISESQMSIPEGVKIVAYEPLFAIGSGRPDTPENADSVAAEIKKKGDFKVLYGGSINAENVYSFVSQPHIDGVLVGGASLSSQEFLSITNHVA